MLRILSNHTSFTNANKLYIMWRTQRKTKVAKEARWARGLVQRATPVAKDLLATPATRDITRRGGSTCANFVFHPLILFRFPEILSSHVFLRPPLRHTQTRRGLMHRAARSTTAIVVSRRPPPPPSLSRGGERDAAAAPGLPLLSLYTT